MKSHEHDFRLWLTLGGRYKIKLATDRNKGCLKHQRQWTEFHKHKLMLYTLVNLCFSFSSPFSRYIVTARICFHLPLVCNSLFDNANHDWFDTVFAAYHTLYNLYWTVYRYLDKDVQWDASGYFYGETQWDFYTIGIFRIFRGKTDS